MKNRALSVRRMVMLFLIIGMLVMSVTAFSGTTYYVHGKLSASTPYGCTISGYVEF